MLDPQTFHLLRLMEEKNIPPVNTLTPEIARELYIVRKSLTQPDAPPVGQVSEEELDSVNGHFTVRIYQPAIHGVKPLPALVYYHGGGWVIGDLESHDVLCRSFCAQSQITVVAVHYRRAPEHKFPMAYHDAMAAYLWLRDNALRLGVDINRIAVGGDSAGGNLSAALCLGLLAQNIPQPALQLLIYPATHMNFITPSHQTNGQGYLLTREALEWFRAHYLSQDSDKKDFRASPLLADSHKGLAKAFVLTAGFDPLRDEGLQYADKLSASGVPTEYVCFERQVHGFITMGRVINEANTAVSLCSQVLRNHLFN
ncbi:MAG: alpha/beta hydrolase [Gammaproteobacteria bacterium]|nr:alpha/beta hydrolase [Gammaproteobacteria bacterium]